MTEPNEDDIIDDYESADCLEERLDILLITDKESCLQCGVCNDCIRASMVERLAMLHEDCDYIEAEIAEIEKQLKEIDNA